MSDLEELARAARLRQQPSPEVNPVPYARPIPRSSPKGSITWYRDRVGHRSWIAQVILLVWTVLIFFVGGVTSGVKATKPPMLSDLFPGEVPSSFDHVLDGSHPDIQGRHIAEGITMAIGWMVVWGIVGLPLGITAIVTLDRK